jgi:hypothetical protein
MLASISLGAKYNREIGAIYDYYYYDTAQNRLLFTEECVTACTASMAP